MDLSSPHQGHSEACLVNLRLAEATKKGRKVHSDGFIWVKYGEKNLRPSNLVREYFKCGNWKPHLGACSAKKVVDRAAGHGHERAQGKRPTPLDLPDGDSLQQPSNATPKRACIRVSEHLTLLKSPLSADTHDNVFSRSPTSSPPALKPALTPEGMSATTPTLFTERGFTPSPHFGRVTALSNPPSLEPTTPISMQCCTPEAAATDAQERGLSDPNSHPAQLKADSGNMTPRDRQGVTAPWRRDDRVSSNERLVGSFGCLTSSGTENYGVSQRSDNSGESIESTGMLGCQTSPRASAPSSLFDREGLTGVDPPNSTLELPKEMSQCTAEEDMAQTEHGEETPSLDLSALAVLFSVLKSKDSEPSSDSCAAPPSAPFFGQQEGDRAEEQSSGKADNGTLHALVSLLLNARESQREPPYRANFQQPEASCNSWIGGVLLSLLAGRAQQPPQEKPRTDSGLFQCLLGNSATSFLLSQVLESSIMKNSTEAPGFCAGGETGFSPSGPWSAGETEGAGGSMPPVLDSQILLLMLLSAASASKRADGCEQQRLEGTGFGESSSYANNTVNSKLQLAVALLKLLL